MIGANTDGGMSHIAVIVVNYGTADLAIKAVESVLIRKHGGRAVTVHLVDNASPGGDAKTLEQAHTGRGWGGRVRLWLETENRGFGQGNNVVLKVLVSGETECDAAFLLNPDAWLENEVIEDLAAILEADPQAAAAGAGVLRADLSPMTGAYRFPSLVNEIIGAVNLSLLNRLAQPFMVSLPPDHPAGPVDWVSGACVMLRMEALREVGIFDPGFFLYYEEVDLMRRLNKAGWKVLYVPDAKVVHDEAAATGYLAGQGERQRNPAYLYRSWKHYFSRAYGRFGALAIALAMWPASLLQIAHRRIRGRTPELPLHFFSDHWRYVIWPLLSGKERG